MFSLSISSQGRRFIHCRSLLREGGGRGEPLALQNLKAPDHLSALQN